MANITKDGLSGPLCFLTRKAPSEPSLRQGDAASLEGRGDFLKLKKGFFLRGAAADACDLPNSRQRIFYSRSKAKD